jgi:predicted PurR-regulated permease PerM
MTSSVCKPDPSSVDSEATSSGDSDNGTGDGEALERASEPADRATSSQDESTDEPRSERRSPTKALSRDAQTGQDRGRQRSQSTALVVLAVVAVLSVLYVARAILLPLVIAVVLTLLLRPVVRRCRTFGIPDAFSAAVVMGVLVLLAAAGLARLVGPAQRWIDNGPGYLREVGEKLHFVRERVQEISRTSEQVRAMAAGEDAPADEDDEDESLIDRTLAGITGSKKDQNIEDAIEEDQPIPVEVRQPGLMTGLSVLSTTGEVLAGIVITVVLTYFLLATGDHLLNNVLHVLPTFRDKRKVVEMVHEVESGVSAYLLTVTLINIGLGIAVGLAMWLLGMPNSALWGTMATVLNFIPYLGAMVGTIVVFLVGVFTFDSVSYALLVPVVYFGLTALEGNLVTPALLGRRMSLSPVVVFLALVFWSWMWGIGGGLIAVPTLAILKVSFDQFDRTRPLGTLIGG